jgi:hypothetical protein
VVFAVRGGADIMNIYRVEVPSGPLAPVKTDPSIPVSNMPLVTGASVDGARLTLYWLWEDVGIDGEFYTYGWLDMESGEIAPIELDVPRGMVVAAPPRFTPDGRALVFGVTEDEQTHSDSTIIIQDLESGDTVEVVEGVNLQFWESVQGIEITEDGQMVLPLDDGSFEVVTLELP